MYYKESLKVCVFPRKKDAPNTGLRITGHIRLKEDFSNIVVSRRTGVPFQKIDSVFHHVSVCGFWHVSVAASRDQSRASDPLEMVFKVMVSHPTEAEGMYSMSSASVAIVLPCKLISASPGTRLLPEHPLFTL